MNNLIPFRTAYSKLHSEFETMLEAGAFRDFESFRAYSEKSLCDTIAAIDDDDLPIGYRTSTIEQLCNTVTTLDARCDILEFELRASRNEVQALLEYIALRDDDAQNRLTIRSMAPTFSFGRRY